jgi:hypothetical protein
MRCVQTIFAIMMIVKGMSYALNNPCKEILYQVRPLCMLVELHNAVPNMIPMWRMCVCVWVGDIHCRQVQVQVMDRHHGPARLQGRRLCDH